MHDRKEAIQKVIQTSILQNKEAKDQLVKAFKSEHPTSAQSMSSKMLKRAVCRIAASKLLCKVFQVRRKQVGNFLATCRSIKRMQIVSEANFGIGLHYKSNKPIFYDSAYRLNGDGECVVAEEVIVIKKTKDGEIPMRFEKCSPRCQPLTRDEVDSILSFEQVFDNPVDEVVRALCDCHKGCPNMHQYHVFGPEGCTQQVEKLGHPLSCYSDTTCSSNLRIFRCGTFHYPVLLRFINYVYSALSEYSKAKLIDTALGTTDCAELLYLTKTMDYRDLLSNEVDTSYEQSDLNSMTIVLKLRQPNLESQLIIEHAGTIDRLEKLTEDFAEHVCVSCERLCQRKNVSRIELSEEEIDSEVWLRLLAYVICTNLEASSEQLYICEYCKPRIRSNELPCRCVLNGLQTVPVPPELNKLDALSAQLIQRARL